MLWNSFFSSTSCVVIKKELYLSFLIWIHGPSRPNPPLPLPPLPSSSSNFLPACCLLGSLRLSLTACDLLFSHAGWVGTPGGERREGRARTYFPEMTFPRLLCCAVINRGLLPQGQRGAAGTAGMKGQKVSHAGGRCHLWLLALFVLPAPRLARRRGGAVGRCSGWTIPITHRLNFSPFLFPLRVCSKQSVQPVLLRFYFGKRHRPRYWENCSKG